MDHPAGDQLELYSLGRLVGPELDALEEHLLVCEWCRGRLTLEDEFTRALRLALEDSGGTNPKPRGD